MGLKESGLRGSLRNVSVGIDAIPDSVDYQFIPDGFDTSNQEWTDELDGLTLDPLGSPTLDDDIVQYDGVDDGHETSINYEAPYAVWAVVDSPSFDDIIIGTGDGAADGLRSNDGSWVFRAAAELDGNQIVGTSNSDVELLTGAIVDGKGYLYEDGVQEASANDDGSISDSIAFAQLKDDRFTEVGIREVWVSAHDDNLDLDDVEAGNAQLIDKYGIDA